MTAANVPFPIFFLPCPGEPAVPFKTWIQIFQNYLVPGAEIPFHCRGGQYMVTFQRVIPGGGHEKIAVTRASIT